LLFREGDLVDTDLISETERNLRSLHFLDNVRVEQRLVDINTVDLNVHTEDQWTLQFNASAGATLGRSTYAFGVQDSNFLGMGKSVGIGYNEVPERTSYLVQYQDPQFLNSRWNFNSNLAFSSDGSTYSTDVVRPFYSMDTRWAYGASFDSGAYTQQLHYKGETAVEIDTDHRNGFFFAAHSWGKRYDKRKFGGIFNTDTLEYPHQARIILPEVTTVKSIAKNLHPINRENYQYGLMFQWDRQHWVEERYLDKFGSIEDMPDGIMFGSMLTRSYNVDNNPDYYYLYSLVQYSHQVTGRQYFTLYGEFSGHRDVTGALNNLYFNTYAHYYFKLNELKLGRLVFPRQTLAANLSMTLTRNIDAPFQISLGEDEGLRGYTFKSFNGQNRVLFNLEDRVFTPLDFHIVAIGLVTFFDAGYVWSNDETLQFQNPAASVGFGLRIGLKKSQSSRVVRVDFAVPLSKQTGFTESNVKGWSISVSSGQIFPVLGQLPKLFQLF
jgi:outer membrane protein assembly factor BamA